MIKFKAHLGKAQIISSPQNHLHVESKKRIQMKVFTKQKQTHRLQNETYGYQRGQMGEGWTGGSGLAYAHYCIWNRWSTGTCYIAQKTLPNIL